MSWTQARARVALAVRNGLPPEQVEDLRRDLRAERLAEHIRKTVEAAPPLTPEQRDRLALLLRGGDAA